MDEDEGFWITKKKKINLRRRWMHLELNVMLA